MSRQGFTTNEQLLALTLDVAAASDGIVPFECLKHLPKRQFVGQELRRIDYDLELLRFSSPNIDFDDAWHRPQTHPDLPFEKRSECHGTVAVSFYGELIDFPQSGCQRSHNRTAILNWDTFNRTGQPFGHQLSRAVDVRPIVENCGDR